MANIENLIPNSERTPEELREMTRKGGIASGEARRKKKLMREVLQECLNMTNNKGQSFQELATLGLIQGAIKGNANNYRTILETLGELQQEQQKDNGVIIELVEALKNAKDNK